MSEQFSGGDVADAGSKALNGSKSAAADVAKTVQSSAQNIGDAVTRNASDVADKVNVKVKEAASSAEPLLAVARERTNDLTNALVEEIRSRPFQAVMAAALVGLVVGVVTSR